MMSLSKREAFQMILDMIFADDDSAEIDVDFLKEQLEDKGSDKEIIAPKIETIEPVKTVEEKPVKKGKTPFKYLNDNEVYKFPKTYRHITKLKLDNDGYLRRDNNYASRGKRLEVPAHLFLELFNKLHFPILNGDMKTVKEYSERMEVGYMALCKIIYTLSVQSKECKGNLFDILYEVYRNKYDVPTYTLFGCQNNQVTVNNVETGIKPFQVKQWFEEIRKGNCEFVICKLMHDNQNLNQKYLFTILVNFANKTFKELLEA